jgi:hypothetical protein
VLIEHDGVTLSSRVLIEHDTGNAAKRVLDEHDGVMLPSECWLSTMAMMLSRCSTKPAADSSHASHARAVEQRSSMVVMELR